MYQLGVRRKKMKKTVTLLLTLLALATASLQAERSRYEMEYTISGLVKLRSQYLNRIESYFEKHAPKDGVYENEEHRKYVRLGAYRLVEAYIGRGKRKKALEYLSWLREDESKK